MLHAASAFAGADDNSAKLFRRRPKPIGADSRASCASYGHAHTGARPPCGYANQLRAGNLAGTGQQSQPQGGPYADPAKPGAGNYRQSPPQPNALVGFTI